MGMLFLEGITRPKVCNRCDRRLLEITNFIRAYSLGYDAWLNLVLARNVGKTQETA